MAKNITLLRELVCTTAWMMRKEAYQQSKATILANIQGGIDIEERTAEIQAGYRIYKSDRFVPTAEDMTGEYSDKPCGEKGDNEYINVLNVLGPITRNGGACSFGSKEHRDIILKSADDKNCLGHLFVIDTPGGSAWAKNDYQQAIDYAHSKGQTVAAFIDGMCCSAGIYLTSMCDRVFYMNKNDEVGCIGVMCEMITSKDGDIDAVTQERRVEIYASTSPDKNIEVRQAAEGDYTKLQAEIDRLGLEFKNYVLNHRKGCSEEYVTGKVYQAGDMEGILVDEQGTFENAADWVANHEYNATVETADGKCSPDDKPKKGEDEDGKCNPDKKPDGKCSPDDEPKKGEDEDGKCNPDDKPKKSQDTESETSKQPLNNKKTMSKNYQKIQEALSLEAFESDKSNGIYLTEDYAEKIESALAEKENYQLTLDAKMAEIAALNAAINSLKTEHETGMANMKAEHEQAVSDLNDGYEQKLNASKEEDGRIIAELRNQLADKEAGMAELNAQIKEKDEQIQTLSENAPQAPLPTAPQAEAAKKSTEEDGTTQSIYSEGMSRAERRAARDARMKTLRQ